MNGLPYYKRYPRDFIEGTVGLPFELKTTYAFLLDLIYVQGGNLRDDARYISGLLGVSLRKWASLRSGLISAGKINVSGEFLTNFRANIELENTAKYQDKQTENGSVPKKNKDLQKPKASHTEPDTDTKIKEEPVGSSKKATRLPQDWQPDIEFAVREELSVAEANREAERFRDYWRSKSGKDGTKLDWTMTWRNWIRKRADDKRERLNRARSRSTFQHIDGRI